MIDDRRKGWALAALGMLLVSTDSYFVRLSELDGWDVAFLVGVLSAPVQLLLQRVFDGGNPVEVFRRHPRPLLAVGLLAAVSQITFVTAVTRTNVANVVVIVAASPLLAAVIGRIFLGERVSRRVWAAILITIVGVAMVVSGSVGEPNLTGDMLAMVAVLAFSINMNIWRRYGEMSRYVGLGLGAIASVAASAPFADPFGLPARAYLAVAAMGLIFNPFGRVAHTHAPRFAPVAEVALFTPIETLAATTWAWLAFSEAPTGVTFVGGVVVICGVLYGTVARVQLRANA